MQLDIRLPLGALFAVLGLLLVVQGLVADPATHARALGHNVNLGWGLVVLGFGVAVLVAGWRARGARPGA